MPIELALSSIALTAKPLWDRSVREERVLGRDMPVDGLLLTESTLKRVELLGALEQLLALGELEPNWDGYGALPIDPATIANARTALEALIRGVAAPDISPNPNGTIAFEWSSQHGDGHLEIGKTRFSFFVKPDGGRAVLAEGGAANVSADLGSLVAAVVFPSARSGTAITRQTYTAGHERAGGQ